MGACPDTSSWSPEARCSAPRLASLVWRWFGAVAMPRLFPFERVSFPSDASAQELLRRLEAAVEPTAWLRNPFSTQHKPFQGKVTGNTFKLSRIIHYRNSFLPTVSGTVREAGSGAVLEATLGLHPVVAVFMTLWLGFAGVLALALGVGLVSRGENPLPALVPTGMFLFGYLLSQGAFLFEAKKAKQFLEELASTASTER